MGNGNRIVQYVIAYAVSLAAVAAGAFATWPAPVMPKIHNNETNVEITPNEMAWMVSMSSPGFMAGSFGVRFLADRFGRRMSILISTLPCAVGTVIVTVAVQSWLLFLARFLWGVGTGLYLTVVSVYMTELADKEIRGSLSLVQRFMFNFGSLLVMCIGPFVSYTTLNYLLLSLPIFSFLGCFWIPETPYYYLKEGKVKEAEKVLSKIRKYEDEKSLEDDLQQLKANVKNEMRHSSTLKELFTGKKYHKPIIITLGLKTAQLCTGQLIVSQYVGLIMMESNTSIDLTIVFIIFGILRFITSVAASFLADRVGRRPLFIYSFFGTGISMVVCGAYFFCKEVLNYDEALLKPYSSIPFFGVMAGVIISSLETKGKSLREIQEFLQGDLYEADEVVVKLNTVVVNNNDSEKETESNKLLKAS
ncbi:sugar transporter domain-containing protein [Phthorimaea operculella]|nr:sugar transporter domain-containing protein [Phthorimaea operculella]